MTPQPSDWSAYIRDELTARARPIDESVVLEWAQHAEATLAAARADGLTADEATARVQALVAEWCRALDTRARRPSRPPTIDPPAGLARGWTGLGQDVRYGIRLLGRQPGFALVALLLVAIGVGATTTLSSLTYAVLLKPLPWPDAGRLVRLSEHRQGETHGIPNTITNGTYLAWSKAPTTIDALAAWNAHDATITVRGQAQRVLIAEATASLFTIVPLRQSAGRAFTAREERPGSNTVIVLADPLARRWFVTPAAALGAHVDVDGTSYEIIGVAHRDFTVPTSDVAAWIPLDVPPVALSPDGQHGQSVAIFNGVAHLKPGATPAEAAAEGTARGRSVPPLGLVGMAVFGTSGPPTVAAVPFLTSLTAEVRPALLVMLAGVGLLFLVAIANVAGMQLARMTARRREVAIRSALGAGPGRLVRQLLSENLAIGLGGGLVGWGFSLSLHRLLPRLLPADFPRLDNFQPDWHVTIAALTVAVLASFVFGIFPALIARRLNLVEALVEDSLAPTGGRARTRIGRMRVAILAAQVAIAALLLTGASVFGRSFFALLDVDRGYDPHQLASATFPMPDELFTGARRAQILDAIVDRLAHTPGVVSAAAASVMPLVPHDMMMGFQLPPGPGRPAVTLVRAQARLVCPDYLATMGMRVLAGRNFSSADSPASEMVVLVNETLAKRYLPIQPLGTVLPITYVSQKNDAHQRVIGIVDDVRQHAATDPPQPEIFFDYQQLAIGILQSTPAVLARTTGEPARLLPTITRIAGAVSPGLIPDSAMTMDDRVMTSLAEPRLYALLFGAFALFALLIAGSGLFGVLSYSVAQRTREIGVRAALGARPTSIIWLVVRQALSVTALGTAAGLAAAFLLLTLVGSLLYGVTTHDKWTFALVPVALGAITLVASAGPARRAARLDPLATLRHR